MTHAAAVRGERPVQRNNTAEEDQFLCMPVGQSSLSPIMHIQNWQQWRTQDIIDHSFSTTPFYARPWRTSIQKVLVASCFSTLGLIGVPMSLYINIPDYTIRGFLRSMIIAWDGLLHISIWPIVVIALTASFLSLFLTCKNTCCSCLCTTPWGNCKRAAGNKKVKRKRSDAVICSILKFLLGTTDRVALFTTLGTCAIMAFFTPIPMVAPDWIWNPLLYVTRFHVYFPDEVLPKTNELCLDQLDRMLESKNPLCLSTESWNSLSSGSMKDKNPEDLKKVQAGIDYSLYQSGGIVLAATARDVAESIPNFKQNVESLVPFFSNVAVVIFENDSNDGSRELIQDWSVDASKLDYVVDLMECEGVPQCKFGTDHRDNHRKAVGNMDQYRQTMTNYILNNPDYKEFSHMLVFDVDLEISLSPLGLMHTLGGKRENAVASSGRQSFPGSFGSLVLPYDFSAFRPYVTTRNSWMVQLHEWFCHMKPEGNRWRNDCDAVSSMQMINVLLGDRGDDDFYRVESAFNGAVIYPLNLIRKSGATYDAGKDGQRCEHIGFNLSLDSAMYVNRKWDMHVDPKAPGGPTGWRAKSTIVRIMDTPTIQGPILVQNLFCMLVFIHSVMSLGLYIFVPFLSTIYYLCRGLVFQKKRNSRVITNKASDPYRMV